MQLSRTLTAFLYQHALKPILFRFDAETVHNFFTGSGRVLGQLPPTRWLVRALFSYQDRRLEKIVDGLYFANPVGLSAGFDYDGDLTEILPAVGFGFQTIGTVTLQPYEGNTKPRLGRFPKSQALLVNKGFKSIGAPAVIAKLSGRRFAYPVGISIGSTNKSFVSIASQINDIIDCFQLFEQSAVQHAYYELNISCPNTKAGQPFTEVANLKQLVAAVDELQIRKPIYVKMPIDLGEAHTLKLLKVIAKSRLNGVIFGNLTKDKDNPAVHPDDRREWATKKGNLSGKPTWERSNALIRLTRQHFGQRFTIIGTGGIFSGPDAAEKMAAGADLLQLITGMIFQGPQVIGQINHYLAQQPPR